MNASTINIETFVEDLDRIRQELGYKKISILGHSWGGFLAMNYAISHSENVDRLILSNSLPASSEEYTLFSHEWARRMAPYQEELESIHHMKEFKDGDPKVMEKMYKLIFRTYKLIYE